MNNASFKPTNVPFLMPYLTVKKAEDALAFYQKAFGFDLHDDPIKDDSGAIVHAGVMTNGMVIMFGPEGAFGAQTKAPVTLGTVPSSNLYIYCNDVDAQYQRAIAAGAKSISEPEDTFWQDRVCRVEDPDGYHWMFATFLGG